MEYPSYPIQSRRTSLRSPKAVARSVYRPGRLVIEQKFSDRIWGHGFSATTRWYHLRAGLYFAGLNAVCDGSAGAIPRTQIRSV
jgi:hypothetical protein